MYAVPAINVLRREPLKNGPWYLVAAGSEDTSMEIDSNRQESAPTEPGAEGADRTSPLSDVAEQVTEDSGVLADYPEYWIG